ncbi:putative tocopherol cyclase [Nymphaea thermarum]|nr:putative tocopherol cyclase [Nymphaea thermarum]
MELQVICMPAGVSLPCSLLPCLSLRCRRGIGRSWASPPRKISTDSIAKRPYCRAAVEPVYSPTPSDRPLRTPHSGYHFDGSARRFFEGWYFKVSIPERKQSFCFMYSIEDPAFSSRLGVVEKTIYGPRFTGVGAQILGADEKYICQFSEESKHFWACRHELILGHTFVPRNGMPPPSEEVPPQEFDRRVSEGFQTVKTARWAYATRPVYGWGDITSKQKAAAGWLAAFPVFEPHWQICMAGGWIEWDGELYEFENAPSYSEKNWGDSFPEKWFWVQCNVFQGAPGEVALTIGGGKRKIIGLASTSENVALIGIHYNETFYEFVPWTGSVSWEVAPWGYWHFSGETEKYKVELEGTTKAPGTVLRAPTIEAGLIPYCKDTCLGDIRLRLWEKTYNGTEGKVILDVTSDMAAMEVGGGPWYTTWKGTSSSPELIKQMLRLPVDVEGFFDLVPILKPPGI